MCNFVGLLVCLVELWSEFDAVCGYGSGGSKDAEWGADCHIGRGDTSTDEG